MSRFERVEADKERRKKEAVERQVAYSKLTIPQKLELLDRQFGPGLGAKKQRAQFAAVLAKSLEDQTKEEYTEEKRQAKRAEE